jgi:hypothetical protein
MNRGGLRSIFILYTALQDVTICAVKSERSQEDVKFLKTCSNYGMSGLECDFTCTFCRPA